MRLQTLLRVVIFSTALSSTTGGCLPGALSTAQRKNLTNAAGESYPVGFLVATWNAARLSSAVFEIIVEEVLGYLLRVDPVAPSSSIPAMYALLGCATWYDATDRGCATRTVRNHVMAESWFTTFGQIIASMNEQYQGEAPVNGGSMGYEGDAGMYVPRRVLRAAEEDGAAMEYYKSYSTRWHQPWKYFDNVTSVNVSEEFMPCTSSVLSDNATAHKYLEITGDLAGVVVTGNSYAAKCEDGYTWMSPSCRSFPSRCIMFFTGGDGWDALQGMQRSAVFSIPLLIGVANSWGNYLALPTQHKALLYWWTPDDTFLDMEPLPLIFPPTDAFAQSQGDFTTSVEKAEVSKVISADLESMAPDLVLFLQKSKLQLKDMNDLMRNFKANSSASRHDVACQWLTENTEKWQGWIPNPILCTPGYGMYDETASSFTSTTAGATKCQQCLPGTHSKPFSDGGSFLSYICVPCEPGTYQEFGTAVSCTPCPRGEYQDLQGGRSCTRCGIGLYQEEVGERQCSMCPSGTTTLGLGSVLRGDCGCKEGTIDTAAANETIRCVQCGEGLRCPFSSSIDSLLQGQSGLGGEYVPQLEKGYAASQQEPLNVHKCMGNCPGGQPGTCAVGLGGRTCAVCPEGQTWNGDACTVCGPEIVVPWVVAAVGALAVLLCAYYFVNSVQYQQASSFEATLMSLGLAAYVLQNVAVAGMMSLRWDPAVASTKSALSIFLLNLKSFGVGCVTGTGAFGSFAGSVALFPLAAFTLLCRWALSRALPCLKPWELDKTMNTMGVFLQVGFVPMVALAVKPFMCYRHPNGLFSLVDYPDVICGESEQVAMVILGSVLLGFATSFLTMCIYGACQMPSWSAKDYSSWVAGFRFLTNKFRLGCWWFGLALMIRSVSFSLVVALFTDAPSTQAALVSVVLVAYLCFQIFLWPWKVPIVNSADALVTTALLLLIGANQERTDLERSFTESFSMAMLLLIFIFLGMLVCLNILALLTAFTGRDHRKLLNLGSNVNPEAVSRALTKCAENLLEVEAAYLAESCQKLNAADLQVLATAITIVAMEFVPFSESANSLLFRKRVQPTREPATSLNRATGSTVRGTGQDAACQTDPSPLDEVMSQTSENRARITVRHEL